MNNDFLKTLGRLLILIPIQVLIGNHIRLFGYINPQLSILFVLLYPLKKDISGTLFNTFFFGLLLDVFGNSGGVNTAALLLIAYMRLPLLKFIYNDRDLDLKLFNYGDIQSFTKFIIVFCLASTHQLVVNSLEYFSFSNFGSIIFKTFTNSLFTTFIVIIILAIFSSTKKK